MEQVGQLAQRLAKTASPPSRSNSLVKQAKLGTNGLPVLFDSDVDTLPRRLISWRPTTGPCELRRSLTPEERQHVEARAAALEVALAPFEPEQGDDVAAALAGLFGSYRSMRQSEAEAAATVAIARSRLRGYPAWAIVMACRMIAGGEAGLDNRFPPNDPQIVEVVRKLTWKYREPYNDAMALLNAEVAS
jgi:hypothetical protein